MQRTLTSGPITSSILLFALPLMFGNLLQQMYNIADTWVVGRFLGADALAAVGSSYTLMTFLTSILLGLCMGSGAAEIFGTSGGVAEAVLRCCLPDKSKNVLRMLEHSGLRGTEAIRFVTIPVNGRDVRVALAHGLANAAKLLDQIENGEVEVDLVEVMSCRTGCVGGAGQPYALMSTKLKRAHGLYEIDRSAMFKRSERNPVLDAMYAAGINERAHELLHHEYKD